MSALAGYDVADQYAAEAIAELLDRDLTEVDLNSLAMDIVQMLRNDGWQQPREEVTR